ncbi:MAG: hypothetical protein P8O10_05070 [Pseudorhodobacter sp.]|nr:hypothetical protein [Pseudorhodobacter sp.]
MDIAAKSREAYVAAGGTIVEMDPADRADWAAAMPDIAAEWARSVNDTGRDGDGMLRAYLAKLEAAGYVGIRDWTAGLSN